VRRWCEQRGYAPGAVVPLMTAWRLAVAWYADRLDPAWRRRTAAEVQALFAGLGLAEPFWSLGA
jgi:hypothetical protein